MLMSSGRPLLEARSGAIPDRLATALTVTPRSAGMVPFGQAPSSARIQRASRPFTVTGVRSGGALNPSFQVVDEGVKVGLSAAHAEPFQYDQRMAGSAGGVAWCSASHVGTSPAASVKVTVIGVPAGSERIASAER